MKKITPNEKRKIRLIIAMILAVISVVFFFYCLMTKDRRLLPSIICVVLTVIYCMKIAHE
jgi:hypothetical protein